DEEFKRLEGMGAKVVGIDDRERYPRLLLEIPDPPLCLFVKGDLRPDEPCVAVVGTRRASNYGRLMAERIARELASQGVCVVSGLARGIDASAHRGALEAGGRTIAVLGTGLDVAYPPENRDLQEEIARKGALLTELPLGTMPHPWNFPLRNRIISGLSYGVVVVEAPEDSGALITAATAAEQGREVFAVPGEVMSGKSKGCHRLIKEGAKLVEDASDIVEEIPALSERPPLPLLRPPIEGLPPSEARVFECLDLTEKHVDTIAAEAGLPPAEVVKALTMLEIKGLCKRLPGDMFVRTA
ncbi:MAG TPA: DNA-protecting protein DprA, partial [Armatimonadetes bacterium]|nr:DNA-protecting protein DprA [Armatimonadota bacterium]